jgi:2-methylisocitrate lyase-like PEP mutase family enzyme
MQGLAGGAEYGWNMIDATREAAERLLRLHQGPQPLVLVNAYDAVTARIIESLGFPAVATTSAGVSFTAGAADGDLPREPMLARVAEIVKAVRIPVTADLQSGYGQRVEDAVVTTHAAIGAGVAGLNFEDWTHDDAAPMTEVALQVERIRAIRATATGLGVPLVINARTDAMRFTEGSLDAKCDAAVARGRAYVEAGADCVFVTDVSQERLVSRITAEIPAPVNVLGQELQLGVARLGELGVRRISVGVAPACYALAAFRKAAREMLEQGTCTFARDRMSYDELNGLFAER